MRRVLAGHRLLASSKATLGLRETSAVGGCAANNQLPSCQMQVLRKVADFAITPGCFTQPLRRHPVTLSFQQTCGARSVPTASVCCMKPVLQRPCKPQAIIKTSLSTGSHASFLDGDMVEPYGTYICAHGTIWSCLGAGRCEHFHFSRRAGLPHLVVSLSLSLSL